MAGNYKRKDHYFRQAKESGYRCRAAFKLIELQKRQSLIRKGASVLDLGCWPGGWLQVASSIVGEQGRVIGIDLQHVQSLGLPNVVTLQADIRDEGVVEKLKSLNEDRAFKVVLSDMSPKLSGIRERDVAQAMALVNLSWWVAEELLLKGGNYVVKLFKSNESEEFFRRIKSRFSSVKRVGLESTRKTSNEYYLAAIGFQG